MLKKYLRHEYLHLGQRSYAWYGSCLLPRRLLDYNIIIYNWWWCRNKLPKTNWIFSSPEISHINCFTQEQLEWESECCLAPNPFFSYINLQSMIPGTGWYLLESTYKWMPCLTIVKGGQLIRLTEFSVQRAPLTTFGQHWPPLAIPGVRCWTCD